MSEQQPSGHLLAQQLAQWRQHHPFDAMAQAPLEQLVRAAEVMYFAPGECIASPQDGPAQRLFVLRSGVVTAQRGLAELDNPGQGWQYEPGDCFPMAALMQARTVTATYSAETDVFVWSLPAEVVRAVAAISPPLAAHLSERVLQLIQLASREQARQATQAALAEQSMERPLGELMRKNPLAVAPDMPLELALRAMAGRRVGSVMVVDAQQRPLGILTRDDLLERITLPQRSLSTPIERVMSQPLRTLSVDHTAQDAALLMSRFTLRHVPVVEGERLVGIVSERDLFALSRMSVQRIGADLRAAQDESELRDLAPRIRELARHLGAQGVGARTLTALIAHLNDLLTERLVQIHAERLDLDLKQAAWLAFGSEGRGEQTLATDQDNGIVFRSDNPELDRPRWLALGEAVCASLADCGFPLCKGGVMASQPACCASVQEWCERFQSWLARGTPEELLAASIYFDARALAGATELADPLRARARGPAGARFLHLLTEAALRGKVPLSWRGALDPQTLNGQEGLDLKAGGTAVFVEAARILALSQGLEALGTRERLLRAGEALGVAAPEREGWTAAFEFLQGLRLRAHMEAQADPENANWVPMQALNDLDRRTLRVSLRVAQRLQQRLQMEFLKT